MGKKFFDDEVRVFAHRGIPKEYPENTLPSFKKACELGVDVIETDVHFTRDKKFVVIHDEFLDRVSNGIGKVSNYTMKDLKNFDAGYNFTTDNKTYPFRGKGVTFISLEELLEEFPNQRFNIDLKDKNPKQIIYYAKIIERYNAQFRILTASEHRANLKEIRKIYPEMATSFSFWEALGFYLLFLSGLLSLDIHFDGDALQIPEYFGSFHVITKSFIKQAYEKGIKIHVWTVNKREDIIRLLNLGVDGIISDDPVLLKEVISSGF